MKFEEILPALREGRKVRRPHWTEGQYIEMKADRVFVEDGTHYKDLSQFINRNDWEIVEEKPKLKKVVWKKWVYTSDGIPQYPVWLVENKQPSRYYIPALDKDGNQKTEEDWITE